jgi:hypothetical protein
MYKMCVSVIVVGNVGLWVIMLCGFLCRCQHFGETYCLYLQSYAIMGQI